MLLPFQKRWVADTSKVKLCVKSRQIGLTWVNAAEDVLVASSLPGHGGMNCYYLCHSKDDARAYIEGDCTMWAKAFGEMAEIMETTLVDPFDAQAYQVMKIKMASGFSVQAMVAHPRNLRGKRGKVTLDEAAYNDNAEEFLAAVLPFTRWGGRVSIISTESHEDTEFHKWRREVEDGKPGREDWSLHVITLDKALEEGLFKRVCLRTGQLWTPELEKDWRDKEVAALGDRAPSELFCEPIGGGDVYIGRALVRANADPTIPVLRVTGESGMVQWGTQRIRTWAEDWVDQMHQDFSEGLALRKAHRQYVGIDVGRSRDLFSLVCIDVDPQNNKRVAYVVELANVPFAAQEVITERLIDRMPRFANGIIDKGGQGAPMYEHLAHTYGTAFEGVNIGVGKVRDERPEGHVMYSEMLPPVKSILQQRALPLPDDEGISDDLTGLRLVDGMPRIPPKRSKSGGQTRHCDTACGIALALMAAQHSAHDQRPSEFGTSSAESWWGGTL